MTTEERDTIEKLAEFIALFHDPLFLQAGLAASAPRLDLQLWKDMEEYERTEPNMAKTAKESVVRHLGYLTEENVVLALFDPAVREEDKAKVSPALLNQPRPES